jgi:hypothetical protein
MLDVGSSGLGISHRMLLLFYAGFFQGTAIVARQPAAARPAFALLAVRYVQALALYFNHFQHGGSHSFFQN